MHVNDQIPQTLDYYHTQAIQLPLSPKGVCCEQALEYVLSDPWTVVYADEYVLSDRGTVVNADEYLLSDRRTVVNADEYVYIFK